jgi:dethiobiotin synthetase
MACVNRAILFITGSDTGVGKTVLATALTRCLVQAGVPVAALKPVGAGGRGDARRLRAAAGAVLTLAEVNPWHFRAPLAPRVAARLEGRRLMLSQVAAHVRRVQKRFRTVVVEGAGGLLSPLGEDFDSRDLLLALRATPVVVCPNRLGAINQTLLVLAALPRGLARKAQVVLNSPGKPDPASRSNRRMLSELLGRRRVHVLPWRKPARSGGRARADRRLAVLLRPLVSLVRNGLLD